MEKIFKKLKNIQIKASKRVSEVLSGAYSSSFKGSGIIFDDVREYVYGDEVRNIDWKLTAKMQHPYIKQYQEERESTVFFIVDISSSMLFGSQNQSKFDLLLDVLASIAYAAVSNNDKIALILFDTEVRKFLPPNRGLRHFMRLIREVHTYQAPMQGTDVSSALSFFSKIQKKSCIAFLISDFFCADFSKGLRPLISRHDFSAICLYDNLEKFFPNLGLVELKDLESCTSYLIDTSQKQTLQAYQRYVEEKVDSWASYFKKRSVPFMKLGTHQDIVQALTYFFSIHPDIRR